MKSFHIRVKHFVPGNTVPINFFYFACSSAGSYRIEVSVFFAVLTILFCTVKLPISYDRKLF